MQVKDELVHFIRERLAKGETQLPPEEELSQQLRVSRATLRAVAVSLQKEGLLSRIHGRGTFINVHAVSLRANISHGQRFLKILDGLGYQASHRLVSVVRAVAPADVEATLSLATDTPAMIITRLFLADGHPAVLAIDHVPVPYLRPEWNGDYGTSVFDFADDACTESITYSITELVPCRSSELLRLLGFEGSILLLEHSHFSRLDQPIILTRAFVNPQYIRFSAVRTRSEE